MTRLAWVLHMEREWAAFRPGFNEFVAEAKATRDKILRSLPDLGH